MSEFTDADFELDGVVKDFDGNNPYYSPEKCGLVIVAIVELTKEAYQFDTRIVWKANDGKLYTARDSGCSCPTPFETFHKLDDLVLLDKSVLNAIKVELQTAGDVRPEEAQEFLYKIRDATKLS